MTQEDKEILLKDLCARLPYDVKVNCNDKVYNFAGIQYFNICILTDDNENNAFTTAGIKYIKPYLFPMSSMSDEQLPYYITTLKYSEEARGMVETPNSFDWLNKNHYDYRGLIPKGLAIDATDKNIY
jgi:hypothetical protein